MNILLTNDDGIQAEGLRALYRAFMRAGHTVQVFAPITEQSAVGHAVTILSPLRVKAFKENGFQGNGITGTPADCVKLSLSTLVDTPPDIVVSGINFGANVGVDIVYSGTVSAATEGALMGHRAIAVSVDTFNPDNLDPHAEYVADLLPRLPWDGLPERCVLNLNFPACPLDQAKGLSVCQHTKVPYNDWYERRQDPRGSDYYWIDGEIPTEKIVPGRDRLLLSDGHITLTPLKFDFNDEESIELLRSKITDAR